MVQSTSAKQCQRIGSYSKPSSYAILLLPAIASTFTNHFVYQNRGLGFPLSGEIVTFVSIGLKFKVQVQNNVIELVLTLNRINIWLFLIAGTRVESH